MAVLWFNNVLLYEMKCSFIYIYITFDDNRYKKEVIRVFNQPDLILLIDICVSIHANIQQAFIDWLDFKCSLHILDLKDHTVVVS